MNIEKEVKMADWSIPDDQGNINVPDELAPLFNKVATQLRFHTISGKNEVITVAHIVQYADEYANKCASLRTQQLQERLDKLQMKYVDRGIYIRTLESEIINLKSSLPEPPKI